MGANTNHNEPLRLLRPVLISLRIPELLPVLAAGLLDFTGGTMTDEHRLATPLDDDVLSLRDARQVNLDLGHGENVGGGSHSAQELRHGALRDGGGEQTERADHHVGDGAVHVGVFGLVVAEVGDIGGVVLGGRGGVHEALLGNTSGSRYSSCTRSKIGMSFQNQKQDEDFSKQMVVNHNVTIRVWRIRIACVSRGET